VVVVRRAGLAAVALAAAACDPEITSGVYLCGEERGCPPGLVCDGVTTECVYSGEAASFQCAEGSNDGEPDETLDAAWDLGTGGCGVFPPIELPGCVDNAGDVDHLAVVASVDCEGARVFEVKLRHPIAFAPLSLEILDGDGAVVATGEICETVDDAGLVHVCAEVDAAPGDPLVVRVRLADGAPDCDGTCAYNRYLLSIL